MVLWGALGFGQGHYLNRQQSLLARRLSLRQSYHSSLPPEESGLFPLTIGNSYRHNSIHKGGHDYDLPLSVLISLMSL